MQESRPTLDRPSTRPVLMEYIPLGDRCHKQTLLQMLFILDIAS